MNMELKDLERLNQLKEKGVLSEIEFEQGKQELLNQFSSNKKSGKRGVFQTIFFIFIAMIVGGVIYNYTTREIFACNEVTMQETEDMVNKMYPNWNNSFELTDPELVKQSENYLECKAKSNFDQLPVLHYTVKKQSDGRVLIETNPTADMFSNTLLNLLELENDN